MILNGKVFQESDASAAPSPAPSGAGSVESCEQSEPTTPDTKPEQQPGYLKRAVTGVASGIYAVGKYW